MKELNTRQKEKALKTAPWPQCVNVEASDTVAADNKSLFEELDQIISMKDENFFTAKRNKNPFNLFTVLFDPGHEMFKSGWQQLDRFYFSFDSVVSTPQMPLHDVFLRDFSSYARISVLNSYSKNIAVDFRYTLQNYPMVDFKDLQFKEVLRLASGQITPEIILQALTGENKVQVNVQGDVGLAKGQLSYRQNTRNQEQNIFADDYIKNQFVYFHQAQLNVKQQRQANISNSYLIEMRNILKKQIKALDNLIHDTKMNSEFEKQKEQVVKRQMAADAELGGVNEMTDVQKKIRLNKMFKNQTEKIKVQHVFKACKQKNDLQRLKKTSKSPRPRSKSRSTSKKMRVTIK